MKNHPNWKRLRSHLKYGVEFPLSKTTREEKKNDILEGLQFGNHKGVKKFKEIFEKTFDNEVIHGCSLVIPLKNVLSIHDALLAPMNVIEQGTINERGEIVDKSRLTHNQSKIFKGSGTSVNSRVIDEKLQDCMYGHCLLRVIHQIVEYRRLYPYKIILMQKIDYKSAYHRLHFGWKSAIQTITQYEELAYISLRLTFSGSPCPSIWGDLSETVADLANSILHHPDWSPEILHSPIQSKIPPDKDLPPNIPFTQALPTIVDPNSHHRGSVDVYIDDKITVTVDLPGNRERARAATPLAIHILSRPLAQFEPIARQEMISLSKLAAEAALEELKTFLGWVLDARRLLVCLPDHKFIAWSKDIKHIITTK